MSSEKNEGGERNLPLHPTHKLAYFLWHDILGNEGDFADAFKDINFKRRYLSNAKRVLKEGADLDTLMLALELMKKHGKTPYSPQMAIDWTCPKSGGKSYYEVAQQEIEKRNRQPPVWDFFAYEEWKIKNDDGVQGTTGTNNLQSDC